MWRPQETNRIIRERNGVFAIHFIISWQYRNIVDFKRGVPSRFLINSKLRCMLIILDSVKCLLNSTEINQHEENVDDFQLK